MKNIVVLENIRSAYNTWNIIRTADALWWDVVLSWYTPDPQEKEQVSKTSLWAEEKVIINQFRNTNECLKRLKDEWYYLIASEETIKSTSINTYSKQSTPIALIMWNEKTWVLDETLSYVDTIYHIPMQWLKESLNVWQAAAIMMWEIW